MFVQGVRKVHELNRHKRMENMISAYRNAGWMSLILVETVNHVVNDCKVCQKYEKSMARLRVTLPKATSFNKVVTLDLQEFGSKDILWMVDSFTRFIQRKLITNKRVDTIIRQ